MGMTYEELYLHTRQQLMQTEEPHFVGAIARDLVCSMLQVSTEQFLMNRDRRADARVCDKVAGGVERLAKGEPLAYVLGEWTFFGLPLYVTPDVLIPRDDTCAVTELAIDHGLFLEKSPRILDLCTGSGCIGIAIASRLKDARVTLADISREALAVAKKNIIRSRLGGRMSCVCLDARQDPPEYLGKFDMIVSNPPYITQQEMTELPVSVSDYEPHLALYGGEDGLDFYRDVAAHYSGVLKPRGFVCFEFGMGQGDAVCSILENSGFTILERKKDYGQIERAVIAQYMGKDD